MLLSRATYRSECILFHTFAYLFHTQGNVRATVLSACFIYTLFTVVISRVYPKWHPIPYIEPYGPQSKVVHYIGNRVPFETRPRPGSVELVRHLMDCVGLASLFFPLTDLFNVPNGSQWSCSHQQQSVAQRSQ